MIYLQHQLLQGLPLDPHRIQRLPRSLPLPLPLPIFHWLPPCLHLELLRDPLTLDYLHLLHPSLVLDHLLPLHGFRHLANSHHLRIPRLRHCTHHRPLVDGRVLSIMAVPYLHVLVSSQSLFLNDLV